MYVRHQVLLKEGVFVEQSVRHSTFGNNAATVILIGAEPGYSAGTAPIGAGWIDDRFGDDPTSTSPTLSCDNTARPDFSFSAMPVAPVGPIDVPEAAPSVPFAVGLADTEALVRGRS